MKSMVSITSTKPYSLTLLMLMPHFFLAPFVLMLDPFESTSSLVVCPRLPIISSSILAPFPLALLLFHRIQMLLLHMLFVQTSFRASLDKVDI
ncbi:hypothetical protein BDF20DRAFT_200969 [Mycotypha africana]|uniref:uncharacterized protein n=1 Tax=Mycotypha africana TaxID=64632 RepID=UPI002301827E|nr:uncharacterized protein BDF20DRAFT_200969 [Mycotypha africana]KAI8967954.1 hypothetical protein BDF20DRAFT_200969 [Mycotypha africana]